MSFIAVAILGAGALTAGAGITGSVLSADAQKSAAQTATNTQLSIFGQTQANLAPYNQAGQSALSQLASLFGLGPGGSGPTNATASAATSALTNYPGYKFGLQQGNLAQQQSAASQGLLLSGSQLQAAQQYGQNYAMQNAWSPYVSQLDTLANQGENAAATTGQVGATTGTSVANSQLAAGQATASGIAGVTNATTGGIQSGLLASLLANNQQNQNQGSSVNLTETSPGYVGSTPVTNLS